MLFFIFIIISFLHLTSACEGTSLDNLDLPKATQLPLFQVQNFDLTHRTHTEEINCENGDVDCKDIFLSGDLSQPQLRKNQYWV